MKNPLKEWDDKKLSPFHIKTTLLAGAGTFVDGYDLTVGALVLPLIEKTQGVNLESASTILFLSITLGTVVGALLFGYLVRHGRKKYYGIDALLMTVGAILQAFAYTPLTLAIVRFLLGVGIGADYVLSPLVNAEYANRTDRGKLMAISGGLMWSLGALVSVITVIVLSMLLPPDLTWRTSLALGAVPALIVIYARRKFPETPRYLLYIKGDLSSLDKYYGVKLSQAPQSQINWRFLLVPLILASATWYLFDVVAYAGVFFGPNVIAESIGVNGIIFALMVLGLFAIPGSIISAFLIDRIGRRTLQSIGFLGMGVFIIAFAIVGSEWALPLFGLYTLMSQIGPGTIVGFWGIELFPTIVRGITGGITVIAGRLGVITTTLLFPSILNSYGIQITLIILGILSFIATAITLFLRETKGMSLDETESLVERI